MEFEARKGLMSADSSATWRQNEAEATVKLAEKGAGSKARGRIVDQNRHPGRGQGAARGVRAAWGKAKAGGQAR